MFPSLMVQPETGFLAQWMVSLVVAFGTLLTHLHRVLRLMVLVAGLILPSAGAAFMARPGTCGSMCRAQWPAPAYPAPYFYPMWTNPYVFYANPYQFFSMMPPWHLPMVQPGPWRTIQSVDPSESSAGSSTYDASPKTGRE